MHRLCLFLLISWSVCAAQKMPAYPAGTKTPRSANQKLSFFPESIVQQPGGTARALSRSAILSDYTSPDPAAARDATAAAPNAATTANAVTSPRENKWMLSKDLSGFPKYTSPFLLTDALYNLALEEMQKAIEPDSTFRTGKEWAGVWTRDISYSIILSMAWLQPRVAKYSLLKKVNKNGRIIQDTGTGGAWPVSSDRMIWAVAAWELYKVTGDKDWLQQAYLIIRNSLDDDWNTIYDPRTGMVKGESSFLDWREQTYPAWMQPADIFESENLGTNAVHYEARLVLSQMARLLHQDKVADRQAAIAAGIRAGVNRYLWMPGKGYYGQYLYGRLDKVLSPRSEALGEALSVLFGIASPTTAGSVISHTPVMDFGIPCIYPQIPDIPPYHNEAVWPFVQTFWLLAAARAGNEKAVMASICAIYRPEALFLTNKENFVARTGDYQGTQINSSNMLWSLSGNLSIVYKVLFGMRFEPEGLGFQPFVPKAFQGQRTLADVHYRDAILDISLDGFGNRIRSFSVDGKAYANSTLSASLASTLLPANLKGHHKVRIVLADNLLADESIHRVEDAISPAAPIAQLSGYILGWTPVPDAVKYRVYKNGKPFRETSSTQLDLASPPSSATPPSSVTHPSSVAHSSSAPPASSAYALYQVAAIDANATPSFLSEPVVAHAPQSQTIYQVEQYAGNDLSAHPTEGYSGDGFTEISRGIHRRITIPISIKQPGHYAIDFRYSNGNGPVNTENKCAIRNLKVDSQQAGALVFSPKREATIGPTGAIAMPRIVTLTDGPHNVILSVRRQ